MKNKVGLWIDHKKAVIVTLSEKGEEIKTIESKVEKQPRRTGERPLKGPFERMLILADRRRQQVYIGQLNSYYDKVIGLIREAESILIFGPGEAKTEFKDRLSVNNLAGRIAGIEPADKMTDPQIAVKVRKYYI